MGGIMTSRKWKGARWWKFDFHTHTPASTGDYGTGQDREELMKREPREWLLDHMRAEIDCVAITDHNQEKKVKDTTCAVMEGGRAAFQKRYHRMT